MNLLRALVMGAVVLALASCSAGKKSSLDDGFSSQHEKTTQFTLDGVTTPPKVCALPPDKFAQAERVPDFREANGCGVQNGYKVYTINDIALSQSATLTCDLADATSNWLEQTVQPLAQENFGERVVSIKVLASYACRPRNNVRGGKLSEHGFGNAIDIGAFTLSDGREVIVARDYYKGGAESQFLRAIRARACGLFSTVLGPGSDDNHDDHIHLDRMVLRQGRTAYCH